MVKVTGKIKKTQGQDKSKLKRKITVINEKKIEKKLIIFIK